MYRAVRATVAPDMIQRTVRERAMPIRERIQERSNSDLVAGWSRSTQHATIRYFLLNFYPLISNKYSK